MAGRRLAEGGAADVESPQHPEGGAMYTSIRKYRCPPDQVVEVAHRADEGFAPQLEEMDGFVAYQIVDCGDGTCFTLTVCRDRESCDRTVEMAADFVRERLSDIEIERVEASNGEALVSRARDAVLEPAHA
jgi:hypothetical protein